MLTLFRGSPIRRDFFQQAGRMGIAVHASYAISSEIPDGIGEFPRSAENLLDIRQNTVAFPSRLRRHPFAQHAGHSELAEQAWLCRAVTNQASGAPAFC